MRPVGSKGQQAPSILASSLVFAVAVMVAIGASGCGPKYPACKNDVDCNKEVDRKEFCVNQLCQKCRSDGDCKEGERCNGGLSPLGGFSWTTPAPNTITYVRVRGDGTQGCSGYSITFGN